MCLLQEANQSHQWSPCPCWNGPGWCSFGLWRSHGAQPGRAALSARTARTGGCPGAASALTQSHFPGKEILPQSCKWSKCNLVRLRGKQIPARPGWITHDWQELNKSGMESLSTKRRHEVPAAARGSLPPAQPSPLGFTVCWGLGCIPASQRMFPFRNAGAEESWAPGGTLRQGSTGRASRASGRRTAAPAPRCWDAPSVFQEFLPWPRLIGMSCRVRTASCTQLWLPLSQRLEYSLKQQEDSTVSKNWAVLLLIPSLKKPKPKRFSSDFFPSS